MTKLLSRILRLRLAFVAMLLPFIGTAQGVHDVFAMYGTTTAQGQRTCAQEFGTYAQLKAARPAFVTVCEAKQMLMTEVLNKQRYEADLQNALWLNETGGGGTNYADGCGQKRIIDARGIQGVFKMTMPLEPRFCKMYFAGDFAYGSTGGTSLVVDHTNWSKVAFPDRSILPCNLWGTPTSGGVGSYAEGLEIHDVMLDGGRSFMASDPTFQSSGIKIRLSGSLCKVENVNCVGFNNSGFVWLGGTPIFAENIRAFYCGQYAVDLQGTSGSSVVLMGVECDDPGVAMFNIDRSGSEFPGGGTITIINAKMEIGHNATQKPAPLAIIREAANVTFIDPRVGLTNVIVPAAFDIQSKGFNASLVVSNFLECGSNAGKFTRMVVTDKQWWSMPGSGNGNSCRPTSFNWTSISGMQCASVAITSGLLTGASASAPPLCVPVPFVMPCDTVADCPPCPACPTCPVCPTCPPPPTELCGNWYKSGSCTTSGQKWLKQCAYMNGNTATKRTISDYLPCSVTTHP